MSDETRDITSSWMRTAEENARALADSVYACEGGCGLKVLKAGVVCVVCRERREAEQERRANAAQTRNMLPPRFRWAADLQAPELLVRVDGAALARAREVDLATVDRVTALGAAGSGKTSLLSALACSWSKHHGRVARFVAAVDLGVARQQTSLGSEAALVEKAKRAGLLLLDDLGAEIVAGAGVLEDVIRSRFDDMKPTLVTSGLTVDQLIARYGAGVARRLLEASGGAVVLQMRGRRAT